MKKWETSREPVEGKKAAANRKGLESWSRGEKGKRGTEETIYKYFIFGKQF